MEHCWSKDSTNELNDHRQDEADQAKTHRTREGLANAVAHATANDGSDDERDPGRQGRSANGSNTSDSSGEGHQSTQGETSDQAVNR